jgi:hypothetical protein
LTNRWKGSNTNATISTDGLHVKNGTENGLNIFADKGFAISGENYRMDQFAGKIIYYYEVTKKTTQANDEYEIFTRNLDLKLLKETRE